MSRPRSNPGPGSITFSVRIQPRASKNEIVRTDSGALKIRLTAPPVDNAANEALVRFLSSVLSVAKSSIEIVSGHTAREKVVRISGISSSDLENLPALKKK